jgi:pyrroloquinoline quinone (PQQ) biosynthesis protein C
MNKWTKLFSNDQGRSLLMALVQKACKEAYQEGNKNSLFIVQGILFDIYNLSLKIPEKKNAQFSSVLTEVGNIIERYLIKAEEELVDQELLKSFPKDPKEYVKWVKRIIHKHEAFLHPLYNQFLKHEATVDDLRYFFIQETTVDARFDDILALMQLGTDGQIKMEMASNYWDEMGNGDFKEVHTNLFSRVMDVLQITEEEVQSELSIESLISGNLSIYMALYRKNFYEAVGYYAATEYVVPHRFKNLVSGWERNNLSSEGIDYHRVHIIVDAHHAEGWFNNVVIPVLQQNPEKAVDITRGMIYRLNSSYRYLDHIYRNLQNRQNRLEA